MKNELSFDRMMSLMTARTGCSTNILYGQLKGHAGTLFCLGRDGMANMRIRHSDGAAANVEVDWLDTDLGSSSVRLSFRARRRLIAAPEGALCAWSHFLPKRVLEEDFADFLERIKRHRDNGDNLCVYSIAAETMFWTALNAVEYFSKQGFCRIASRGVMSRRQ